MITEKIYHILGRLVKRDRYFYGILIVIAIFLGQLPIILHILHTPNGYYYPYLDKVSFSDYYYISLIRYGSGSDWLLHVPYVIADHQGSLIQIFFIMLGKLSLILNIGPAEILAVSRVIGGLIYLLSVILLLRYILSRNLARWVFIVFLVTEPLPSSNFITTIFQGGFMNWIWHFGEAVRRISVVPPHYTFGRGLAILSVYFFLRYLRNVQIRTAFIAGLIMFVAGMIYPPPVFILTFCLAVALLFSFILTEDFRRNAYKKMLGFVLFFLLAVLPLIILKIELNKGYPWNRWNEVELGWNTIQMNFETNYLLLLGLPILFMPFSINRLLAKDGIISEKLLILLWFISPFIFFPLADLLRIGKFRFSEGAQIVAGSILVLWGFDYVVNYLNKHISHSLVYYFKFVAVITLIANFIFFTSLSTYYSIDSLWSYYTNVYLSPDELAGFTYLTNNAYDNAVVLADVYPSNYIPAFVRVKTIIGFPDFFKTDDDFNREKVEISGILNQSVPEKQAVNYLVSRKVDYIYNWKSATEGKDYYPALLERVFSNNTVVIYKVKGN